MGRLGGHPMRREETIVKLPEKTMGPKINGEWNVGGLLWFDDEAKCDG